MLAALPAVIVLLLSGCATTTVEPPDSMAPRTGMGPSVGRESGLFPVPPEIADNVDFWRHVYGMWSRGDVAIHDDEHLGVIYEVARLPGAIQNGYTASQESFINARKALYKSQLADLEQRVRSNQRLTSRDEQLLQKFKRAGGVQALYGASDRVRVQRGLRERFRRGVEISGRYDRAFREIMRRHGVPEDLAYLPHVESSFQTAARSSVGAAGVWQFMPSTGRQYMTVDSKVDERYDPILAAQGAARYLSQAHARLGSWPLAITSYNHGQGGMAKAKERFGGNIGRIVKDYDGEAFGFASRNFYAEFVAAREVASHPNRYFQEGVRYEEPWMHDRIVLRESMPADHLARHYGVSKQRLADMNNHWREGVVKGGVHLPAGCTVWLPAGTKSRIASQPSAPLRPVAIARVEPKPRPVESIQTRTAVAQVPKPSKASKPTTRSVEPKAAKPLEPKVAKKPVADSKTPKLAKKDAAAAKTPKLAADAKKPKETPKTRVHVVKAQETLYRVAVQNGITVDQLRKLNKLRANDNSIRPGQKLIVGI